MGTHSSRRRLIQRSTPLPFVWGGLLPLLGLFLLLLYALLYFAHTEIEAVAARQVRAALAIAGDAWVRVAVSGQDVDLSGVQPAAGAGDAALAVARAAACPSWAGSLTCGVEFAGRFSDAPAVSEDLPPVATAPASPTLVPAAAAVAACEKSLADIVGQTQIDFGTGSAGLAASSGPVLDALAKAAANCDGVIRVEGHTDSTGNAASNRSLSGARAAAVVAALVERGFPGERLRAEGFGSDRPIADNASAIGRARNRRIEFRVVTDQDN